MEIYNFIFKSNHSFALKIFRTFPTRKRIIIYIFKTLFFPHVWNWNGFSRKTWFKLLTTRCEIKASYLTYLGLSFFFYKWIKQSHSNIAMKIPCKCRFYKLQSGIKILDHYYSLRTNVKFSANICAERWCQWQIAPLGLHFLAVHFSSLDGHFFLKYVILSLELPFEMGRSF